MKEDTIRIHDKRQCEFKYEYQFDTKSKVTEYFLETYFFIPYNLGVNKHTYSKKQFYQDVQSYIRFKTPQILLKNVLDNKNVFIKLKNCCQNLASHSSEKNIAKLEFRLKLFACILKSAFRDERCFILKHKKLTDVLNLLEDYLTTVTNILLEFRKLKQIINVPTTPKSVLDMYEMTDEYISNILEVNLIEFDVYLKKLKLSTKVANARKSVMKLALNEKKYRVENNYLVLTKDSNKKVGEKILFKLSVLKKYIGSILFIDTKTKKEGTLLEQILFAIAAGIAMTLTTIVIFVARINFGNITMPFFFIVVISYMFKDRIKDIVKLFFQTLIKKHFYDKKTNLYSTLYSQPSKKFGVSREGVSYISDDQVPLDVGALRKRDSITAMDNAFFGEQIILYKKKIKIFSKKLKKFFVLDNVNSINDILRLDIRHFLTKMDNPRKDIFFLGDEGFEKMAGNRVYHINVLIKYSKGQETDLARYRLILDKKGIKRIEKVN